MIIFMSLTSVMSDAVFFTALTVISLDVVAIGTVFLYEYLYYKFYYYYFEIDKAEIRKGVVAVATGHVRYVRIQNIFVDQDILDRIFGLYDVHYETAGETSGFYSHVDGLNKENADKLIAFLNERVSNKDFRDAISNEKDQNIVATGNIDKDQATFDRKNVPIDKKVISSMVITSLAQFAGYAVILFYMVYKILQDNDITISTLGVPLAIFIGLPILSTIGTYIWAKIWYQNFYFKFGEEGGMIRSRVIAESSSYLYYDRIQNINVSQGIVDRLLGINKLVIETAAEGTKSKSLYIPGLLKENAETLKSFLLEKSKKYRSV